VLDRGNHVRNREFDATDGLVREPIPGRKALLAPRNELEAVLEDLNPGTSSGQRKPDPLGVPRQGGVEDPPSMFAGPTIVKRGTTLFDPSYGVRAASITAHEVECFAGMGSGSGGESAWRTRAPSPPEPEFETIDGVGPDK